MFRGIASARHRRVLVKSVLLVVGLAALGAFVLGDTAGLLLAPAHAGDLQSARAQMVSIPGFSSPAADRPARPCRPPTSLCGPAIQALEQGAFLDFRAGAEAERATPRLLSPFAILRIEALDKSRCAAKLCAAHVALAATLEELLREGYYTQSVALFPGSAILTLRTERIDGTLKPLKGSCRFNLDPGCVDFNTWLQEDQRSGGPCGFAQTRVFLAASTAPDFVPVAAFAPLGAPPTAGVEALRLAAFDAAGVKVYELIYVHKICRNEMVLVRNG